MRMNGMRSVFSFSAVSSHEKFQVRVGCPQCKMVKF